MGTTVGKGNWEEQMEHEPTREYYERVKKFNVKNKTVLEIGLQHGISARAFLENGAILTSVDPTITNNTVENLNEFKWEYAEMRSEEYFKDCDKEFSFIYIDGDHHHKSTKSDMNNGWVHLSDGGTMVVHDFGHNNNFRKDTDYGITQAVCEFAKEREVNFEVSQPYPMFAIIKKK